MALSYWLFAQCKKCGRDLPFRQIPKPTPEQLPLKSRSVRIVCPDCGVEAVYAPSEIRLGELDREDE
jgi:predicted RNA-binding Zn-ribbon protein involved in translation (DUF1610 family)